MKLQQIVVGQKYSILDSFSIPQFLFKWNDANMERTVQTWNGLWKKANK